MFFNNGQAQLQINLRKIFMLNLQRAALAALAMGCAPAVFAQSSVQLYGRINTSVEYQKMAGNSATGLLSNGSFLGLRGVEDLGNGMKAGFVLESAFSSDDGAGHAESSGLDFKRRSELNLQGQFGMLRMGTFDNYSYTVTGDAIAWHNDDTGVTSDSMYGGNFRRTNTVAYRTPTFGGWHAEVGYQLGENEVGGFLRKKNGVDLGVNYANGPWGLGLGMSRSKMMDVDYGDDYTDQLATLRLSYSTDAWAVGAYYQRSEEKVGLVGVGNSKRQWDSVRLAAMYRLDASEFHLNVGRSDFKMNGWSMQSGSWEPFLAKGHRTQWTVAYHYNFSPRSKAYVFYTHHSDGPHWDALNSFTGKEMGSFRSVGVGIRHLF